VQSRITEFDPLCKLAIAWEGSGDVSFELIKGQRGAAYCDSSPPAGPRDSAWDWSRLAHAPRLLVADPTDEKPEPFWDVWIRVRKEYDRRMPA